MIHLNLLRDATPAWLGIAALLLALQPQARADQGHHEARKLRAAGTILPLEKITESAKAVKPGKILEIELERKGERYVYDVDILDAQGAVWDVKLDARSGQLIKLESEY